MILSCAHCLRQYPREDFTLKRRERRRMWNGSRVVSAIHDKGSRPCHRETEYPEGQALTQRKQASAVGGKIGA